MGRRVAQKAGLLQGPWNRKETRPYFGGLIRNAPRPARVRLGLRIHLTEYLNGSCQAERSVKSFKENDSKSMSPWSEDTKASRQGAASQAFQSLREAPRLTGRRINLQRRESAARTSRSIAIPDPCKKRGAWETHV